MTIEEQFDALEKRLAESSADNERVLIDQLERSWTDNSGINDRAQVTRWAAHFLANAKHQICVWDWLMHKSRTVDLRVRTALIVGVFENVFESRHHADWLKLLMGTLCDPQLHWIVLDLYEDEPARLYSDLSRLNRLAV